MAGKTGNQFIDSHFIFATIPPMKAAPKKTAKKGKVSKPVVRVNWKRSGNGWTVGTVSYKEKSYHFEMKNFLEPSVFGIDKGCISKLFVCPTKPDTSSVSHIVYGDVVMNYDRGWDIKPTSSDAKAILKALTDRFNRGMNAEDSANYRKYVW